MLVVLDNVLICLMYLIIDKINNHLYDVLNMHGKFGFHIVTLWLCYQIEPNNYQQTT